MFDPLVRTVGNMMARFGGNATLVKTVEGAYDPDTSLVSTTTTNYTIRVIGSDYIQKGSGFTDYMGGLVQTGDKQLFIKPDAALPAPLVDDVVLFEGKKWRIIALKTHNPSGSSPYLYEAYMRL